LRYAGKQHDRAVRMVLVVVEAAVVEGLEHVAHARRSDDALVQFEIDRAHPGKVGGREQRALPTLDVADDHRGTHGPDGLVEADEGDREGLDGGGRLAQ